jgi:hypothetical protein
VDPCRRVGRVDVRHPHGRERPGDRNGVHAAKEELGLGPTGAVL